MTPRFVRRISQSASTAFQSVRFSLQVPLAEPERFDAKHVLENAGSSKDLDIAQLGPRKAGKLLSGMITKQGEQFRYEWMADARAQAILGSCPKSWSSALSA